MDTQAYQQNIGGIVANGFVSIAIALGQKLGIFEALKNASTSLTASELAMTCNLKERYTEEWLGCMVSARVVLMDDEDKYFVPENCKEYLTPVKFTPFFFLCGEMHKKTMDCFSADGSPGYDFKGQPDEIGSWMDNRMDFYKAAEELLVPFKDFKGNTGVVLEIGSGHGALSRNISKLFPDSEYIGIDCHPRYMDRAQELARKEGIKNVTYMLVDAESLPKEWTGKFDWVIMFDVLHDLPHPKSVTDEVCRVLKDNGVATIVDPKIHSSHRDNIGDPMASIGFSASMFSCLPCSSSLESSAKHGIGWGDENRQAFLEENGFEVKDKRLLCQDPFCHAFTCVKKN